MSDWIAETRRQVAEATAARRARWQAAEAQAPSREGAKAQSSSTSEDARS